MINIMDNNKKFSLPLFLKIVLVILIPVGIILYVLSGVNSLKSTVDISEINIYITGFLYVAGGFSLFAILFNLIKIVNSLIKKTPFIWENVKALKRIAVYCFTIAGSYIINFVVNNQYDKFQLVVIDKNGVHTDFEFLIFLFAGCFIFILSQVFKQAIEYKEENDLTI